MASWSWCSVTKPRSLRILASMGNQARMLSSPPCPRRLMALRLNSLKTRTALAIASVIVATLVLNAVYLILTKRAELRAQIEHEARTFAELTKKPLAEGRELY